MAVMTAGSVRVSSPLAAARLTGGRWLATMAVLLGISLVTLLACLQFGVERIGFADMVTILARALRAGEASGDAAPAQIILVQIRLPRILLGFLVGGCLAAVGVGLQAFLRNPLADPYVLGVSSGAALGAVLVLHLGLAAQQYLLLPGLAFLGALLAALTVYGMATSGGKTPMATLLLSGVAVGSLNVALMSFILSTSRESVLREILFWLMGGLEASTWEHVRLSAPVVLVGACIIFLFTRDLDILLFGEQRALTLGVDAQHCRHILLTLATAITAVVVSFSGTVGFVGLVVPHMLRLLVGPNHQRLLPASFLGGAVFLVLADLVARTLLRPQELRLGVITAFVGVPFFLYLLRANRRGLEPL